MGLVAGLAFLTFFLPVAFVAYNFFITSDEPLAFAATFIANFTGDMAPTHSKSAAARWQSVSSQITAE